MTTPGQHDFVSSPMCKRASRPDSAVGNAFMMSGGLGDLPAIPTPELKQADLRPRFRSLTSSDDDEAPLTKRKKIETIDLTSSPETTKSAKVRSRASSTKKQVLKPMKGKTSQKAHSSIDPTSSPPPAASSAQAASASSRSDTSTILSTRPKASAVVSPKIPSCDTATSFTARPQRRKGKQKVGVNLPSPFATQEPGSSSASSGRSAQVPSSIEQQFKMVDAEFAKLKHEASGSVSPSAPRAKRERDQGTKASSLSAHRTSCSKPAASEAEPARDPGQTFLRTLRTNANDKSGVWPRCICVVVAPSQWARRVIVFQDQRFARDELSESEFAFIWHRCDPQTQHLMRRLLRHAWHLHLTPRLKSLAEFFSEGDDVREWLNERAIPRFCPKRVGVVDLVGDDGSGVEEDEDESVIGVPDGADSEWVGSSRDGESTSGSRGDGDGDTSDSEAASSGKGESDSE